MQPMFAKRPRRHFELWLSAARDGMIMLLPLTLIRVAISVAMNLPWNYWPEGWGGLWGIPWSSVAPRLDATLSVIMGLGVALCVGNRLHVALQHVANSWLTPMLVHLLCLVNFLIGLMFLDGSLENSLGQSLLLGILTGIITVEALHLHVRLMPRVIRVVGMDGNMLFRHAFHQLGPAAFTSLVATLAIAVLSQLGSSFTHLLQLLMATDLIQTGGSTVLNLLIISVNQLLWFVGMHGGILVAAYGDTLLARPEVLFDAQLASNTFINAFAYMGGSGATFGLVLAIVLVCKDKQVRRLGKYSVLPAVFNINEILIFGLPIIFSPIMLFPFLLAPLAAASIAMAAHAAGWLQFGGQQVNWNTPIFISGYVMSGGLTGVLVQIAGLLASTALYLPFVRRLEVARRQNQSEALSKAMVQLCHVQHDHPQVLQRFDSLGDFARALHTDFETALGTTQVFQVYQPKHDTIGRVCGVEALLRWTHPEHGAIMPAAIVNVAEESHLINKIGKWSLETACATLQHWKRQGVQGITMSVNLSPVQLEDTTFVAFVQHCLQHYALSPSELELEITEGRTLAPSKQADAMLRQLCDMGVQLSMDDFGMGYSSLLYMQRFSMSAIKIDGSLTRDVISNDVSSDIIRTIGLLGQKQGVRVVAEFVETLEQRNKLADLGCDEFQGYFYSPAIHAQTFLTYWRNCDEAYRRMIWSDTGATRPADLQA
ncbi:PTS sugar transporter subunit IIC/EAL domain-containing protein [Rhodoferax sp. 4810]|nr:PTS sugar transporter subunit IIC/EAL domain-containing protein [Rhodoferax jenense]